MMSGTSGSAGSFSTPAWISGMICRSEEHTSELQSLRHLVCRLLLEKKNLALDDVRRLDLAHARRIGGGLLTGMVRIDAEDDHLALSRPSAFVFANGVFCLCDRGYGAQKR